MSSLCKCSHVNAPFLLKRRAYLPVGGTDPRMTLEYTRNSIFATLNTFNRYGLSVTPVKIAYSKGDSRECVKVGESAEGGGGSGGFVGKKREQEKRRESGKGRGG